jgi:hypothetical protein
MTYDIERLLGLAVVVLVAVGAVLLLLRLSDRTARRRGGLLLGYPPDIFPEQEITGRGPLLALATTQARLASIYRQLPPQSDLSIWLRAFLNELREIMDTAYRVSVITQVYGQPAQLDSLIAEVQTIEKQVADHVVQRLLARESDAQQEWLEGRLAALRMCARELQGLTNAAP